MNIFDPNYSRLVVNPSLKWLRNVLRARNDLFLIWPLCICSAYSNFYEFDHHIPGSCLGQFISYNLWTPNKLCLISVLFQSFSLRPTITERPNLAANVPAKVSVTAILEKANAIRQVFPSSIYTSILTWLFLLPLYIHHILPLYHFRHLSNIRCLSQAVASDDDSWSED